MKTTLAAPILACALVATPLVAPPAHAVQSPAVEFAARLSDAYAEIAGRLEASVVSIDVTEDVRRVRRTRDAVRETESAGSGFVIDPAGLILTNNHVVDGARSLVVRLSDGRALTADVVGSDPESDLALVRVAAGAPLPAAPLGDSDAVRPGHLVLALGSPFGFTNSVSAGIVSASGRFLPGEDSSQFYIQTDAAIHPGNSGGPLVNMAGEVIGTAGHRVDGCGPRLARRRRAHVRRRHRRSRRSLSAEPVPLGSV